MLGRGSQGSGSVLNVEDKSWDSDGWGNLPGLMVQNPPSRAASSGGWGSWCRSKASDNNQGGGGGTDGSATVTDGTGGGGVGKGDWVGSGGRRVKAMLTEMLPGMRHARRECCFTGCQYWMGFWQSNTTLSGGGNG
ncbi:hypothetical protein AAG906_012522 [Vitis piasezkii]